MLYCYTQVCITNYLTLPTLSQSSLQASNDMGKWRGLATCHLFQYTTLFHNVQKALQPIPTFILHCAISRTSHPKWNSYEQTLRINTLSSRSLEIPMVNDTSKLYWKLPIQIKRKLCRKQYVHPSPTFCLRYTFSCSAVQLYQWWYVASVHPNWTLRPWAAWGTRRATLDIH